jgi:hypothetical protein
MLRQCATFFNLVRLISHRFFSLFSRHCCAEHVLQKPALRITFFATPEARGLATSWSIMYFAFTAQSC